MKSRMNSVRTFRFKRYDVFAAVVFGLTALLLFGAAGFAQEFHGVGPPILSASEIHYPPFCMIDAEDRATGFSVELLRAAAAAMGREVVFHTGLWEEVKGLLERGEIQALPLVGRTPEREALLDFTFPYMSIHGAVVVRNDTKGIRELSDLTGKRVAVMKSDNAEEFLRRRDRGIDIHTTATFEEALRELSEGLHDAVVIQRLVGLRLIQETGLSNLRVIHKPIEGFRQDFSFAVQEGDKDTLALLNEGLALVMADGTYRRLHAKWFAALELPSDRRIMIGGDHNYPPYEYVDENGRPAGYNVELTRAIALEVGLDIEIRLGPWTEIVRGLESGDIDAVQGMFYSLERDRKFDFTQPHTVNHGVGVVRKGSGAPPATLHELAGKRIVVQRGDILHEFLVEQGFGEQVSAADTQEAALRELAEGKHDCALVARLTALYWIERHGWTHLTVGKRPLLSPEYCYAVPNDHKPLLAQFSEGLKMLEESGEYRRIQKKWMGFYGETTPSAAEILRYAVLIAAPLFLILLASFLWSWSLRKQVAARTEELRKSEEFQRSIIACSPVALYSIDPQGNVQTWNASAERMFGWTAEEVLGGPLPTVPEDRQGEYARTLALLMEERSFVGMEVVRRRKDGSLFDGSLSTAPIKSAGGHLIGIMSAMQDISERKHAEKALGQREAMLARTEGIAHIGSWEWDIAADAVTWSDELFRIFQRDPAGGAPSFALHSDLYHPDDMPRLLEAVEAAVERGSSYEVELRALRPDGTVRHCLARGYPERGTDGQVVRLYGSLQDITDFKRARERIEHLNTVLRAIRDVNQLIVHERDRDTLIRDACRLLVDNRGYASTVIVLTDENDRPVSWAEAGMESAFEPLAAILERGGAPPCCEQARSTRELVHIQDRRNICVSCPLVGSCTGSDTLCIPLIHDEIGFGYLAVALKQGLGADSEEQSLFREMAGDLAYALHVLQMEEARDKIQREHQSLQNQMIQAQKMESVGRLAGGVAHDYNNMLSVIIGYTELALDKVDPGDPLHADLKEILSAATRSSDITRQLLAFARKQTISPRVLDLNDTVEGMFKMLRRLIGEDIDLAWLPGAHLWPVRIDPAQIDQILANLCVNARDAIAGIGRVTIETERVILDETYCAHHAGFFPGEFVLLAVSDDGCGMDAETLDRIFEPFFTTKNVDHGTGLGLATVYGIVKQNNGFINVYSEPGKGATFKIYLPRHEGKAEAIRAEVAVEIPLSRGETVLLVEDERAIMNMGKVMLERLGYHVLAAGTPGEALRLARERAGSIHALITDVVMPEMNGRDLADRLHALYPDMKAVFMSGYTANVIAHRGVLEEGVHFVQKPFSLRDLASKVRAALDSR